MKPDEISKQDQLVYMRAYRKTLSDIMCELDQLEGKVESIGDEDALKCLLQAKMHIFRKRRILDKHMFALDPSIGDIPTK